ncbi:MAG TPA: hypothetical protein VK483_01100 [Chitinophagaceae bacterium]|nr:hypothetical protein [Chitinophagaceae bacterium]
MLKFLTSLSFLYAFSITVLLLYGLLYYKSFVKNGYQKRRFPVVFLLVSIACFSFLYFNINASLKLKTFSNLDHHFIRHDGFRVAGRIELGRTDTINYKGNSFNRFVLNKQGDQLSVSSPWSEDPFYAASGSSYRILSVNYPAAGHSISFHCDSMQVAIKAIADSSFELRINNENVFKTGKRISKGSISWNIFKDDLSFINSAYYTNEKLVAALRSIMLVRDDVSRNGAGALKYFLSGRLFQYANGIIYDEKNIQKDNIAFTAAIADKSTIAWGIGFLDNNRNQFRINALGADSFALMNRYPVSYPLTEENREDWSKHSVNKFLVSDPKDMLNMPPVFGEGFLFAPFSGDSSIGFLPVLLTYQKSKANDLLQLQARFMNGASGRLKRPEASNDQLILPAKSSNFGWVFSIQNSFDWNFGKRNLSASEWQLLLFGTLLFFFIMIFASSWLKPGNKLSWIWQLLTCVTMVLLTTRFFLYWRYKSFPPYEGLDLPSQQQLNSFWNFGIIIFTGIVLAIIFGYGFLQYLYVSIRKRSASLLNRSYRENFKAGNFFNEEKIAGTINSTSLVKKRGARIVFFIFWVLILLAGGGLAAFNRFDPTTCRHLAIGLTLLYFIFIYISYKHSPLVTSAEKSWWNIHTGRPFDIIINNPVKVLLSVSLLGLFAFVDMGFAIVFLNFLLFNEAFLCINYAIAGLSAGSKRNASLFGLLGFIYLLSFAINLIYGPYIFRWLLELPQLLYIAMYILFAIVISIIIVRLLHRLSAGKKLLTGIVSAGFLFTVAFLFFPKERILKKAGITKYRIDVMAMPLDKAIETAYEDGKTYEPVIRAAQNQWFINTFIYEKNNPAVNSAGFHLLPHAPQNKGAKYNAQATDLVASRFFIAEHGRWSVLLYVLLLLLPATLLASFYKLYPDFTNRINNNYPTITAGFSLLNYLLITALLVILAATGRYIFFGQDLPFGSILSKQSILFPSILIVAIVLLFRNIPLEHYPNQKKMIPGAIVFTGLALLLFLVKPVFNKNKEFNVTDIASDMDSYIELRLQPLFDHFDTSRATRKQSISRKDQLFTDSVRKLLAAGFMDDAGKFFGKEIELYTRSGFSKHLDQSRMLYLDLYSGKPKLAVNDNYFRIEPPPHLQQFWTGNVFSDSSNYNITLWNAADGSVINRRMSNYTGEPVVMVDHDLQLVFKRSYGENLYDQLCLINRSAGHLNIYLAGAERTLKANDTLLLRNPDRIRIADSTGHDKLLVIQPDAFMKNYYVNGSRFYVYPMSSDFIWAKNFAESVSSEYTAKGENKRNAFVSLDAEMTDSLSAGIQAMMITDTAYKKGAEYGICIADGNGRLVAMTDFIKELDRPDPNDKAGFNKMIRGENGFISQSLLRKEIGNINLLRMNPGPGSTLKPIVFTSIASQLNMDWDAFAAEGFSQKQEFFGGEKVAEYDFEKNNGRIASVVDYLRYSDNYYHSNLLLLGSYSRQSLQSLLAKYFATKNPEATMHWPYFSYNGKQYWLDGFENWPGYINGKANFGSDSSFLSIGLFDNYGIYTYRNGSGFDKFSSTYDSLLFREAYKKSGFILPEYALFDQKGTGMDKSKPNEVFMSSFRGHVKGSSQVMIPPVKMLDAFGKMTTQNRNYSLTLNPYATEKVFSPFYVDNGVSYSNYLNLLREKVFEGMKQALFSGTASRLGGMLKDGSPYYYYAKTGTTGDDEAKTKSKLFAIVISQKDVTDPDFNFRKNKFYTIYFTSQNGPAKQNEEFQAAVIKKVQESAVFKKYMGASQ